MKPCPLLAFFALSFFSAGCAATRLRSFDTPAEAVQRLADVGEDRRVAEELLGPDGASLLDSGDEVADREDVQRVRAMILERIAFLDVDADTKIALLGADAWELPVPLVRDGAGWRFDAEAGREEVLNRRVGRNELSTLASLHALVEAQREYAAEGHDGNPPAFARHVLSGEGRHDGLYWPVAEGEVASPLGPWIAAAAQEGYTRDDSGPVPYHGYFYRPLTAQGIHAPGGARDYLDAEGRLTGGFAFLAWPATWGNSGVMTFQVNHQGIVFQKDLGPDTERIAATIRAYDPDESWDPTAD